MVKRQSLTDGQTEPDTIKQGGLDLKPEAGLIVPYCPDSSYGRGRCYFRSEGDARRCQAGGVVTKGEKINKLNLDFA